MKVSLRIVLIVLLAVLLCISGLRNQISVAQQQLPDLTITLAWQDDGLICYTLKNISDMGVGGTKAPVTFYNYLFIDDMKVAVDQFTGFLAAGQEIKNCFDYKFQMTPPQHTVTVCADWQQNINESNEKNNCWEQVWTLDVNLPDLIVDKIECDSGNKLSITVKNNGNGPFPANWNALGEIFFNDQSKGVFSLTNATSTFGGGIAEAGGSSTYLLSWEIMESTLVRCAVDIMNNINESDEQNNIREENIVPTIASCPEGCDCLTLNEAKEQGYALYCNGTQTLCGYDSSGTPKYCWVKVLPPPDLIIRGIRLNILGSGEYEVEYTIANWGHGDAPSSISALYVDDILVAEESITSLLSAEERDEVFSWHFNSALCTPPSDIIRVVIDYRETIDESYEDNNEGSITWECTESPPPDLRIRRTWTVPLGTGEHQIGYEIENVGTGPAPASNTGLYVDGMLVAEDSVGPLAPMERTDRIFSYIYDLSSCSGVDDVLTIYVDDNREISETNEGNNSDTLTWSCPRRAEPDLVIHSVWWESEPASLQNLTLHYSIENRSVTASGASITRLWINGTLVASSSVPALAGGEIRGMITFSDRWTPQINSNHVRISVDADNAIEEGLTGEMNNSLETDWVFELNCYNRFQDRDETGIDCGGSYCPACDRCDMTTLPDRWDWRDYFTLPNIRDQQSCGSCWAHAALGAMEGTYAINTGLIIDLSEQYAICDVPGDCDGGCPHDVFRHARSTGIIDESCQTYLAANSPCTKCSDWRERLWTIADYERVSSSINTIKRVLICYGPLSVCSENWLHCIVIVGYDDARNCWIIRNSWGLGWGDDLDGDGWPDDPGYGSIPYTGHSHSDVRDYVHYVIGVMAP